MSLFRTCDWWEAASSDPGSLQYDVASLVVDSLAGEEDQQVEHCTALYCTVMYCTVLYCTVPAGRAGGGRQHVRPRADLPAQQPRGGNRICHVY